MHGQLVTVMVWDCGALLVDCLVVSWYEEHTAVAVYVTPLWTSSVAEGQTVMAGSTLGTVGNTGLSTGCHLHWMTWDGERLRDPLRPGGAPAHEPPSAARL